MNSTTISPTTATSGSYQLNETPTATKRSNTNEKKIEAAVYSHIQAMRTLGNTRLSQSSIAEALGLSGEQVRRAIDRLSDKGIRPLK